MNKEELFKSLDEFIKKEYIKEKPQIRFFERLCGAKMAAPHMDVLNEESVEEYIKDELKKDTVADVLNRYMFEKNITTGMIYERVFIDRKLISKISKGDNYHPSKITMLSLCIALRLNITQAEDFLRLAGYSINPGSLYDIIIKYVLLNEIYDIDRINEMLYKYNLTCIGG